MVFYIRYPGVQTDSCQNKKPGSGTPGPYGLDRGGKERGEIQDFPGLTWVTKQASLAPSIFSTLNEIVK